MRSAYAILTDQPITGIVTALTLNPPFAKPVSFSPSTATPFVSFNNAFSKSAGGLFAPFHRCNYKDAYVQSYNFNVQQQFRGDVGVMLGYFGNKGTNLNLIRNINQPVGGFRPYPVVSGASEIGAGRSLGTLLVEESVGNSNYNALWLTMTKRFSRGLQFNGSYTWSKSLDYNSRNNNAGATSLMQDAYNLRNDYGPSDYDARHRFVVNGVYDLPFKGNRLVTGWEVSTILQLQSGNPINFRTTNASLTGIGGELRPSIVSSVQTGISPAANGSPTAVQFLQNPTALYDQGARFGNLGRNAIYGPGFYNLDFALVKNTKLTEKLTWQIRADAFDILNQKNFTQPVTSVPSSLTLGATLPATSTFGLITGGTRFPAGDSGSSRQIQVAMKLIF